jgi:hypothetical protein
MPDAYICYAESELAQACRGFYTASHRNKTASFAKESTMSLFAFALPLASAVACVVLRVYLAVNSIDDSAMFEGARG